MYAPVSASKATAKPIRRPLCLLSRKERITPNPPLRDYPKTKSGVETFSGRPSKALADGENVSLRILEPSRLGATSGCDAVLHHHARHVVLLEHYAPCLELVDFSFDIVDLPVHLTCL